VAIYRRRFVIPAGAGAEEGASDMARRNRELRLEWCHSRGIWAVQRLHLTVPYLGPGPVLVRAECNCRSAAEFQDLKLNRGPYARPAEYWPVYRLRVECDEIPEWAKGFLVDA
jgi:hypothetical protein